MNKADYEVACFIRHLAMANVGGGWMADYDVVPLALPACAAPSNDGLFTTHEGHVPSLVSATASEYLRVSRLFGTVPWASHPELFTVNGRPHVSDMHALKFLNRDGSVKVFENRMCGVVDATFVFDSAGHIWCRDSCPLPPQPAATISAAVAMQNGSRMGQTSNGPLGAHFSHTSMRALSKGETRFRQDGVLPNGAVLALGLRDLFGPKIQGEVKPNVNYIRGWLVALVSKEYRRVCV